MSTWSVAAGCDIQTIISRIRAKQTDTSTRINPEPRYRNWKRRPGCPRNEQLNQLAWVIETSLAGLWRKRAVIRGRQQRRNVRDNSDNYAAKIEQKYNSMNCLLVGSWSSAFSLSVLSFTNFLSGSVHSALHKKFSSYR